MDWQLIADIGGTNMRLAAGVEGQITNLKVYPTIGRKSILQCVEEFIAITGKKPDQVAFACAGIVNDGSVRFTNADRSLSEQEINQVAGVGNSKILNDFEAAAWSLATVCSDDVKLLQGALPNQKSNMVIIGPGTGLGVGAMTWQGARPVVIKSEGGHIRLSPQRAEDEKIFSAMARFWPETQMGEEYSFEAEAFLSGSGLPYLYQAIGAVRDKAPVLKTPEEIFKRAKNTSDLVAQKTIEVFLRYLGGLAGDMAVTFSAVGGVFLCGGILGSNSCLLEDKAFLKAFNQGGRYTQYRTKMPVGLYTDLQFGLRGALNYLQYNNR